MEKKIERESEGGVEMYHLSPEFCDDARISNAAQITRRAFSSTPLE